tara:strand:+ start:2153 stop:2884 length:732 start_codon:yes stop_codon:yes gene_type:complete
MDFTIEKIPKIISIEGNIGAGKTTFVKELKKIYKNRNDVVFLTEPVDIWQKVKDNENKNILERFYEDNKKYAFSFQIMAYVTRLNLLTKTISENPDCKLIITERSLDADKNVFAKMLYDDNCIDDINYNIYLQFYDSYKKKYNTDGIIFINADSFICHERVTKRDRTGEHSLSLEYLQRCDEYHVKWLYSQYRVLNINASLNATYNTDHEDDPGLEWLKMASQFINSTLETIPDLNTKTARLI